MDEPIILRLDGVSYGCNRHWVIENINLEIRQGEFLCIIGPNGAGKSTLLRLISGVIAPRKGTIFWNGRDLFSFSGRERAREIAYLPADLTSLFDFRVAEILAMGRFPYQNFRNLKTEKKHTEELTSQMNENFPLQFFWERSINSLSSGERQLVFLAQALIQEPRLLILDEPTVHLDWNHQHRIFTLLKEWNQRQNITVIIVSHNLNLTALYSSRLVLLDQGSVFAQGKPDEVFRAAEFQRIYGQGIKIFSHPRTGCPQIDYVP